MNKTVICHAKGKDPLYKTWHASDTHLIMYIHAGEGSIVCAENIYPMSPGMLVYIAADTYHYTMPDEPDLYDRSKFSLPPQSLAAVRSLLKDDWNISGQAVVCAHLPEAARMDVERIYEELSGEHTELLAVSDMLRLLHYLRTHTTQSIPSAQGFVAQAICFIGENISWDIRLADVCRAVNVSKFYLCRSFKEHTGMTVMEYILNTRIVLAKNELKKTSLSIMEISARCGFSSTSYFCRVFREKEGCTPLQYRRLHS